MICDQCKEREAKIQLTQVENDQKTTVHLCEECAEQRGLDTGAKVLKSELGGFLASMSKAVAGLPAAPDGLRCGSCGSTLKDFRDSGRLGCAHCYASFEGHLRDLLRRLHGSSQHLGERYRAPGAEEEQDPKHRLLELREQLRRAVEDENFELAAELRDQLRVIE
jgi:protein arginine kinase activator